ncbi:MAG: hypothetical protein ABUL46_01115, partial [Chitinophaga rupis]
MKKTNLLTLAVSCLLLAISTFVACSKIRQEGHFSSAGDAVANAKVFYDAQASKISTPDSAAIAKCPWKSLIVTPIWDRARVQHINSRDRVVVPVQFDKPVVRFTNGNTVRVPVDKNTFIVIYNDTLDVSHLEVVSVLQNDKFFNDEAPVASRKFNGSITVRALNGDFIKGYYYVDGAPDKLYKEAPSAQVSSDKAGTKASFMVTPQIAPPGGAVYIDCDPTDWYIISSSDGGDTWQAEYWYTDFNCTSIYVDNSDTGVTSDGASYTTIVSPYPTPHQSSEWSQDNSYAGKHLCQQYSWATVGHSWTASICYLQCSYVHNDYPFESFIIGFTETCL